MSELAINGGVPVRDDYLPYGKHHITDEDIDEVGDVLRGEWLTTGPQPREFERELEEYLSSQYVKVVNSGTSALICAVSLCGLSEGDEVITTPLSFAATTNAILFAGAKPVFADVKLDTCNIDPFEIEKAVTGKTRAVIILHYGGHPADMDEITEICEGNGLHLIEDCAHSLGAEYKGVKVGNFGRTGCFSTHPVKHIATGEGGFISLQNEDDARYVELFRNQGIDTSTLKRHKNDKVHRYDITALGYNFRMSDISAVLGRSQLRRHKVNLEKRREIADLYFDRLAGFEEVILPVIEDDKEDGFHLFPIRVREEMLKAGRDEIILALRAEGIGATLHYPAIHTLEYHEKVLGYKRGDFPNSEKVSDTLITIPLFPQMTEDDVEDVVSALDKVIGYYRR